MRVSGLSYGCPPQSRTMLGDDSPMPRMKLPPVSWLSVSAAIACTSGVRVCAGTTAVPMRMPGTPTASAPAIAYASPPPTSASHSSS